MKTGLLFTGQGAQYTGMGLSLYENSAAAKKVFDDAGDDIKEKCFNGTKEILKQTNVTQPCVYTVAMAAYAALNESVGLKIAGVAGFSLGEYSALTAAGVISDIKKGLEIVSLRGKLMMEASLDKKGNQIGGMIAALGKRQEILDCVEAARESGILEAANFNSPTQIVVAGDVEALKRFSLIAAIYRIKAIPLSVSTAFHTPMLLPVEENLRQILTEAKLNKPELKIYSNVTSREMDDDIVGLMVRQVHSPVMWQETLENMAKDGIKVFIELGPGTSLSGMVKKTVPNAFVLHVEDAESLEKTVQALTDAGAVKGGKQHA